HFAGSNFSQRSNHLLILGLGERRSALQQFFGAARGHHNQFEPVGNFSETILNSDTGHSRPFCSKSKRRIYSDINSEKKSRKKPQFATLTSYRLRGTSGPGENYGVVGSSDRNRASREERRPGCAAGTAGKLWRGSSSRSANP